MGATLQKRMRIVAEQHGLYTECEGTDAIVVLVPYAQLVNPDDRQGPVVHGIERYVARNMGQLRRILGY